MIEEEKKEIKKKKDEVAGKYRVAIPSNYLLNVRSKPYIGAIVLDTLRPGTIVNVIDTEGDFSKIVYKKTTAYVMTNKIAKLSE